MDASASGSDIAKQDDVQIYRSSKLRSYSTASLTSRLQIETETLAKAKVKEDIMQYKLQLLEQEMQEVKEALKEPITNLTAYKKELQQQLEMESVYESQIQSEILNTKKMVDLILAHYKEVENHYGIQSRILTELNQQFQNQQQNNKLGKENLIKQIKSKKAELKDIQECAENEMHQYQMEMMERMDNINKLKQSIEEIKSSRSNLTVPLNNSTVEYEKNHLLCAGLNENINSTQTSIKSFTSSIEGLEAKGLKDKKKNDAVQKKLNEEAETTANILSELERKEKEMQQLYDQENFELVDIEDLLRKLDDEKSKFETEEEQLSSQELNLNSELNNLELKYNDLTERLNVHVSSKEEKLKDFKIITQENQALEQKLFALQMLTDKLKNDASVNTEKSENLTRRDLELTEEINTLKTLIKANQEKFVLEKEIHEKLIAELDLKLSETEEKIREANNRYNSNCLRIEVTINDYKHELNVIELQNEQDNKNRLEERQMKVAKLTHDRDEKAKRLNEITQSVIEKKALRQKCMTELNDLQKQEFETYLNCNVDKRKPVGILKSPGQTGISPKKVKFNVARDSVTGTESEATSQQQIPDDVWSHIFP